VAEAGSVKVNELFGVYSYSHVHQLVSTISSEMEEKYTWKDAINATFPMGSMTGAPKISAMQWIEKFEKSNREWYSGALGYIDPSGNMDFNVLIRTIFYDSELQKLAYYAGGAITIDSNPDEEYYEMMVKAKAINGLLKKYV
ncbi:MAG: chorismate-binding protein, partial [Bacteroidia bacterium]